MTDLTERPRSDATPVSWQPNQELTFTEWEQTGKELAQLTRSVQWWIGDWLNYGAHRYGEKYSQALEITGYDYGTLRNMAHVAASVNVSLRDDTLTWTHHKEVAVLPPEKQAKLLARASEENWSTRTLHRAVQQQIDSAGPKELDAPRPSNVIVLHNGTDGVVRIGENQIVPGEAVTAHIARLDDDALTGVPIAELTLLKEAA